MGQFSQWAKDFYFCYFKYIFMPILLYFYLREVVDSKCKKVFLQCDDAIDSLIWVRDFSASSNTA